MTRFRMPRSSARIRPRPTRFESLSATEVPLDAFRQLTAGDILFVDTTHTVKLGSDVNFVVLDLLPELPSGVIDPLP